MNKNCNNIEVRLEHLQNIMVENALSVRAIPKTVREVVELRHKDKYPGGYVEYIDSFKREMWVYEKYPKHGGQFVVESKCGVGSMIRFSGKRYYNSLEEVINDFTEHNK